MKNNIYKVKLIEESQYTPKSDYKEYKLTIHKELVDSLADDLKDFEVEDIDKWITYRLQELACDYTELSDLLMPTTNHRPI